MDKENYYINVPESEKLLRYLNQFWICFNQEDKKDVLEILLRALDRIDAKIDNIK